MNIEIKSVPFSLDDNFSEEALEDFQQIQKDLPYGVCQSIGLALAKLELLEKQDCKVDESRWISCNERQPKENGNYLAFYRTSDGSTSLEFMMVDHCNAGGGWLHEENGRKAYKKVIAWMPLPEPYKEESEGEE